jgi:5-methylcytosine-specific restriction endonuclease McrA
MTLLRVCRCGKLIPATRRRCPNCDRVESTRRRNKPSGKVYADPRWRKTRLVVLERDDHTCRVCGAPATHVDHQPPVTILLARGESPFDPAYCRACCASCAGRADAARAHQGGRGGVEKPVRPPIPHQLPARKLWPACRKTPKLATGRWSAIPWRRPTIHPIIRW